MIKTPVGERRHFVIILEPISALGEWNNPQPGWRVFARARAALKSHSGREFFAAQQRQSEITDLFNTRYLPGVTQKMRLVYNNVVYDILDVDNIEGRHAEMNLVCKAVV
jgi:SPP1 family predicted phage head-tail adaptor